MERRQFLGLAAGAAALSGCTPAPPPPPAATPTKTPSEPPGGWVKDPAGFVDHGGKSLEPPAEKLTEFLTPNDLFFVRNNSETARLELASYKLVVEGDAVEKALQLSYQQLRELPSRTIFSTVECGGNQRAMFGLLKGKKAKGTQWRTGGVGNAVWTGVPLVEVLRLAGVKDNAVDLMLSGLDTESPEEGFRRALPLEKAMHPDTLLAYSMNGDVLPPDHGFPLRAIVPGWVGSSSIKWLGHIEVSSKTLWSRNNTTSYTLIGENYPVQGKADGIPCTEQSIKSALALPWPASLKSQRQKILGYAHSPGGKITKVEWSQDAGKTWALARLLEPQVQYSWARFEFEWDAKPGEHTLTTRATDEKGNSQPESVPHNEKGYLFNQPLPHPVTVS